jgi:hypothetical protein
VFHFGKKDPVEHLASQQQQLQTQIIDMSPPVAPVMQEVTTEAKRTWSEMSGNTQFQYQKKPKTIQQQQLQEQMRRIQCSVECREESHVEWALHKISQLSTVRNAKTKQAFHVDSIRGLLPLLLERLQKFLQIETSTIDNYFNNVKIRERLKERLAFISLIILRNCSFEQSDQVLMVTAYDDAGNETLIEILLKILRRDVHLEWQTKVLDILHNLSPLIKLSSYSEQLPTLFFEQMLKCLSDKEEQLHVTALEILNCLINDTPSSDRVADRVKQNANIIEQKLNEPNFQQILSLIIGNLRTPSSVHHVNEPTDDDEDDEEDIKEGDDDDNVEFEDDEESTERRKLKQLQKRQQEKMKSEKQETQLVENTSINLSDVALLCRSLALHFLNKLVNLASDQFIIKIANSNQCVTRLVELLVWKSGLQSRMRSHSFQILKNLRDQKRKREQDYYGQAQYQHVIDPNDEDFDQDEIFDDYGDDASALPKEYSSSQLFQTKCATILAQFAKTDPSLVEPFHHEFMFLIMFTKPPVSNPLCKCIEIK